MDLFFSRPIGRLILFAFIERSLVPGFRDHLAHSREPQARPLRTSVTVRTRLSLAAESELDLVFHKGTGHSERQFLFIRKMCAFSYFLKSRLIRPAIDVASMRIAMRSQGNLAEDVSRAGVPACELNKEFDLPRRSVAKTDGAFYRPAPAGWRLSGCNRSNSRVKWGAHASRVQRSASHRTLFRNVRNGTPPTATGRRTPVVLWRAAGTVALPAQRSTRPASGRVFWF